MGDNFPQTVGNLANVKGVLIPPETLALKDALCWRTPGKHENVSGEPWLRQLTGLAGMESPAWHEPSALQRAVWGRSSPGGQEFL